MADMTWIDYAIVTVVVLSMLLGVLRGFVRETFSLVGWIMAFILSGWMGQRVAVWMPEPWGDLPRLAFATVLVFVATVFLVGLVGSVANHLTRSAGLAGTDRALGALFGLLRGALVVVALLTVGGLTSLSTQSAWNRAVLLPGLTAFVVAAKPWLPQRAQALIKVERY